jgi:hypothetical protein
MTIVARNFIIHERELTSMSQNSSITFACAFKIPPYRRRDWNTMDTKCVEKIDNLVNCSSCCKKLLYVGSGFHRMVASTKTYTVEFAIESLEGVVETFRVLRQNVIHGATGSRAQANLNGRQDGVFA